MEPTKIANKLSVNSRWNSIYKKIVSTSVDIALQTVKKVNINSERFARNTALLARPQTFVLHHILPHVSSSEFIITHQKRQSHSHPESEYRSGRQLHQRSLPAWRLAYFCALHLQYLSKLDRSGCRRHFQSKSG